MLNEGTLLRSLCCFTSISPVWQCTICLVDEAESSSVCLSVWLWAKPLVGASGGAVGCWVVFVSVLCENALKIIENMTNSMAHWVVHFCLICLTCRTFSLFLSFWYCIVSKHNCKYIHLKCVVAWDNPSHGQILKFSTIYSSENFLNWNVPFSCLSTNAMLESNLNKMFPCCFGDVYFLK